MPAPKPKSKSMKTVKPPKIAPTLQSARLDILFSGPLLFVPTLSESNVSSVEVFSPSNGHPVGAVFLPGVIFSDAELNDPQGKRWPDAESFSLLDPHSYSIDLTQQFSETAPYTPFPAAAISEANHKIKPGRRLSGDWELSIAIRGSLTNWTSHRLLDIVGGVFHGADAPTSGKVAITHRLTYNGITGAEFCGVSTEPREYLRSNIAKGGSLIVLGEIPYQSTLLHERQAVSSIAKLAGLDLHMVGSAPIGNLSRPMGQHFPCGFSIIVV